MGIVITGMGMVTPIGNNLSETWSGFLTGKLGGTRITHFPPQDFRVQIAAEVPGWTSKEVVELLSEVRAADIKLWMARASHFTLSSVFEALNQSGLNTREYSRNGGIWVGNGGGGIGGFYDISRLILERKENKVRADSMIKALQNMIGAWVARYTGIKGPTQTVQTACASSLDAIATARAFMTSSDYGDQLKYAVVIGTEAALDRSNCAGFAGTGALSTRNDDPPHASRPFDKTRDGFVASEGAGAMIIEDEEFAKNRGATPLARLDFVKVGCGGGGEVRGAAWLTEPNVDECEILVREGLRKIGWSEDSVMLWIAHGTSTIKNDAAETELIHRVFGEHARNMFIPAPKSMIGHGLGASGIWGLISGVMCMRSGWVLPTMNLHTPDPACDLNYVPNKAIKVSGIDRFVTAALGFGDQSAFAFAREFNGWEV